MSVVATQVNGETVQAIGAEAQVLYGVEASWGTAPAAASRTLRLVAGETIDQNVQVYQSKQLRPDRMRNAPVRGSQDPGGNIPFELSPNGWNNFLYHLLLPTAVTTTGPTGGLLNATTAPTGVPATTGGTLATASYYYKYTATNAAGETLPSAASSVQSVTGPTGAVALTATAVTSATGYNFYRATASGGPYYYAGSSATTAFTDTGAYTGGTLPVANTTGAVYTHVVKAGTVGTPLPIGFSLEKGFMDLGNVFELITGCKVDKMSINFKVDAIPSGTFDIVAQQFATSSTSAFSNGSAGQPSIPNEAPYTGAQIGIYSGTNALPVGAVTGTPLGLCNDLQITVSNQLFKKNGFILGSTLRQNLKPGTRMTDFTGKFIFQDLSLYNQAINGTNTSLKVACISGSYSHIFDIPTSQLVPSGSSPKIASDGPIEISLKGQSLPDVSTGTDIVLTIKTAEANITN